MIKPSNKKPTDALFTANVPFEFTDDQLGALFDPFGIVISSRLVRDPHTGQSRGFGFVELATDRAKKEAIAALNGTMVEGRRIEVRGANNKAEAPAAASRRPTAAAQPQRAAVAEPPPAPVAPRRTVVVEYKRSFTRRPATVS